MFGNGCCGPGTRIAVAVMFSRLKGPGADVVLSFLPLLVSVIKVISRRRHGLLVI